MYYVEVEMKGAAPGAGVVTYQYRRRCSAMAHVRRELAQGHVCVIYWAPEETPGEDDRDTRTGRG